MFLDFVLIFTVILCFFMGYKKGFTSMFVSLLLFVFSVVLVTQIYGYLEESFFSSEFGSGIVENISENINSEINTFKAKATEQAPFLSKYFLDNREAKVAQDDAVYKLSLKTLQMLVSVPLVVLAFILFKILLKLIKFFAHKAHNLPVIGGIDSVLGSLCGLIAGVIVVALIYTSVCYLQFFPSTPFLEKQIDDSLIIMLINDFFV